MSENGKVYGSGSLAQDLVSNAADPESKSNSEIEKELRSLMDNPRCPEGLQKKLWEQIVDLRNNRS